VITWLSLSPWRPGMLALQGTRRALKVARNSNLSNRRHFVQGLCDGFMDLALALPIPPSLPPYSSTIIILTLVSRLALLPISIWVGFFIQILLTHSHVICRNQGKERTRRAEEIVIPQIKKLKPLVSKRVLEEMKKSNIRGDKKYLQKYHDDKCIQLVCLLFCNFKEAMYKFIMKYRQLTMRRKELLKQYKCSPLPSIIVPTLSQLPFFVCFTVVLSRLSVDPTPFDSESFFTLSTLAHPDPTMTLPVILGFLTMANVESGNWVLNAAEREQVRRADQEERKRVSEGGKPRIHVGKILKTSLRGFSIVRIIIAAMTPGVRFSSCFILS
jgi:mitochondrial inner membrane protein COX18